MSIFEKSEINLGEIKDSSSRACFKLVKNVHILSIRPSCGCIQPSMSKTEICVSLKKPSFPQHLSIDKMDISKHMTIYYIENDIKKEEKIYIKGYVLKTTKK
jgi:hypothetical protein